MTYTEKMSTGITTNLFDEFDEFNAFDVTVEPDEEKRDTYSCEVWAYSEDNVINDISVIAKGADCPLPRKMVKKVAKLAEINE
jgi:hypothetical protein